jgi:hypothetical protein
MTKIFVVYGTSQHGDVEEWPWLKCAEVFELNDECRTEACPKFGEKDTSPRPTDLVFELDAEEAKSNGIDPGFFSCPLSMDEAESRLNCRLSGKPEAYFGCPVCKKGRH